MAGVGLGMAFRKFSGFLFVIIAFCSSTGRAGAMDYQLLDSEIEGCRGPCPKLVFASGTISLNEHTDFLAFVSEARKRGPISNLVIIHSPGGFAVGGLKLGTVLRKLKMSVMVANSAGGTVTRSSGLTSGACASACVFALAGGVQRFSTPGSLIGVHRSHTGRAVLDPVTRTKINGTVNHGEIASYLSGYFRSMGVNPALTAIIDATPSEAIRWLTADELRQHRVLTR